MFWPKVSSPGERQLPLAALIQTIRDVLAKSQGRARARTLNPDDLCYRIDLRQNLCVWGFAMHGGSVARSYGYPASTTRAVVAWAYGRWYVSVARERAPTGEGLPAIRDLSPEHALALVTPDRELCLLRQRSDRLRRRLTEQGFALPPEDEIIGLVYRWTALPIAAVIDAAVGRQGWVVTPLVAVGISSRYLIRLTMQEAIASAARKLRLEPATLRQALRERWPRERFEAEVALARLGAV